MIEVAEPQNELLKQFVDSIYILKKSDLAGRAFTAYPTTNTPVGLLRNAAVHIKNECIHIGPSPAQAYIALGTNQFSGSVHLQYEQLVDEIAINFKPLGFASYTQSAPKETRLFSFGEWDAFLPELFNKVFACEDRDEQLEHIEQFLLTQYRALPDEAILLKVLELLNDTSRDYKMQEIAGLAGMHYKQLYRSFTAHVGCSPAHYRKLVKFRSSVLSKIQKGDKARLVDICYNHDYIDQPYFIRQFKELTGEKPSRFFKAITSFGNDKVIFKIEEPVV